VVFERIVVRPTAPERTDVLATIRYAHRRGFHRFVAAPDLELPPEAERIGSDDSGFEPVDGPRVPRRRVTTPSELDAAIALARAGGAVAIEWAADRVIPLETAVAGRRGQFELWVETSRLADVSGFLGALEHGADVVVVDVASPHDVDALETLLDHQERPTVVWTDATVRRLRPVGLADRVLLDTTSLLRGSEGFAIGSRAATLFLVLSEAEGSRFSRPRPFRVNAGPAHSYVLMADGTTRYLSEVEPGEELLAIDTEGRSRGVRLGRRKTERRPTILVEIESAGTTSTIFLQEAETVRLATRAGPVPVTELVAGTKVLAVALTPGRHLGEPVTESIEER
jgi:3-dehydroquinate synthase II